ncbi:MAG: helix-hairpin-helix domain-containing protein [Ureaplasma sp.]|nr:helix-hairpin-helix domain-containing protein [Ureaplasma sp.]
MERNELIKKTSQLLNITEKQVDVTLSLLEEGATIPFIARYRKEMTNNLNEDQIKEIDNEYKYQINLANRKEAILNILTTKELLTPELENLINSCEKLSELENIYKPYKEGKKTKASIAIKLGLKPFAEWIMKLSKTADVKKEAEKYLTDEVKTVEDAISKAKDIIAEIVSNDQEIRDALKETIMKFASIKTELKPKAVDENEIFKIYYDFGSWIKNLTSYRIMAINRAEAKKIISVRFDYRLDYSLKKAYYKYSKNFDGESAIIVREAIDDSFKRLIVPSVENDVRNTLTEKAEQECSERFARNLEQLLYQSPIRNKNILGWDPGFRTGCKLAVISKNNDLKLVDVVFPFNENKKDETTKKLIEMIENNNIDIIAIGNGTASRESEEFIANLIKENNLKCEYCIVSEAGASVYSASKNAQKEFPDLTVEKRSAISIGRRIIDPLAELIKIPPLSIGVGQYQHDLPEKELNDKLDFVVSKVVNKVGVDVNTASEILLSHVSGLTDSLAKNIVEYRQKNNYINSRNDLLNIKGFTDKKFEQASGFLRVIGNEVLDKTDIHPESYQLAYEIMKQFNINNDEIGTKSAKEKLMKINIEEISSKLNSDIYTIQGIINGLTNELRDYRDKFNQPILRKDILNIENLTEKTVLQGTVRNILDFGAFIDIGIKEFALLHKSQMNLAENQTVYDVLDINDIVNVSVILLDLKNKKIQVSLVSK